MRLIIYEINRLIIYFREGKRKNILFTYKWLIKRPGNLDITYDNISIKQYPHSIQRYGVLDESIELKAINKINSKLKTFNAKNNFLDPPIGGMMYNILLQPHFD